MNNRTTEIVIRDINMTLNVSNRSLELCSRMNYETENLDFIDKCSEGDIFYDIGACEGRFALYAAKKGLVVHAFEPEQMNYEMLSFNVHNNSLSEGNIFCHNVAVSDRTGEGIIKIGQPWPGGHQKVVDHGASRKDLNFDFKKNQKINLVELDKFIVEKNLPKPNWLKVDVDGSEVPFLKGAHGTLKSSELKGIIFELNKADEEFNGIIENLEYLGWIQVSEHQVPNEPNLFNFIFDRKS